MEQYIHLLIARESEFVAPPRQVAEFAERIVQSPGFQLLSGSPWQPGLLVLKPTGRTRVMRDPRTGEAIATNIPVLDRALLQQPGEIAAAIDQLAHYDLLVSGQWDAAHRPIALFSPDGVSFEDSYSCTVSCHQRAEPVSMSDVADEPSREAQQIPNFGQSCSAPLAAGYFTNPWTEAVIEVPNAGCARFWIEFEFGKFIFPKMTSGVDSIASPLLSPALRCRGSVWSALG